MTAPATPSNAGSPNVAGEVPEGFAAWPIAEQHAWKAGRYDALLPSAATVPACKRCRGTRVVPDNIGPHSYPEKRPCPDCTNGTWADVAATPALAHTNEAASQPVEREALKRSREGWQNVLELDLLPPVHRGTARMLISEADAALTASQPRCEQGAVEREKEEVEIADEAVDFVFDTLARNLGLAEWEVVEGSEDWHGDVSATLHRLLIDAGIVDEETGAIAALSTPVASEPAIPAGMVLVPVEPTEAMLSAGEMALDVRGLVVDHDDPLEAWSAMIAASPAYTPRPAATDQAAEVAYAAQFLCDRLDDLEWIDGEYEATLRDYMGHVEPAHERLKSALTQQGAGTRPEAGEE